MIPSPIGKDWVERFGESNAQSRLAGPGDGVNISSYGRKAVRFREPIAGTLMPFQAFFGARAYLSLCCML
jgi:hypothetical protein